MSLDKTSKLFLQSIFGAKAANATVEWWTFDQTTGKAVGRKAAVAAAAAPGEFDSVYWSVGMMKAGKRSNANVESVHALVADDVGTKAPQDLIDLFMPAPTAVVETSHGNCQYVWAIAGGMTVAQHQRLWAGMEALLGRRMDGSDPGHLFRLPQGVNGKPGKTFVVGQVGKLGRGFSYAEMEAALPLGAPGLRGSASGGQKESVAKVKSTLALLPNDGVSVWCADRKAWIDMGMAIKGALGEEGFPVWEEWCSQQPQEEDPLDVWEGLSPHSVGFGFIEILAKQHGGGGLAGAVFDDGRDLGGADVEAEVVAIVSKAPKTMDDFWAHGPSGRFIYGRLGDLWPAGSVDGHLPWEAYTDAKGKTKYRAPSKVLQRDRLVDQISWVPGRGQVLQHTAVREGGVVGSPGNTVFNLYKEPERKVGNAQMSLPWVAHVRKLYPGDAEHIFDWFAHRVQKPGEKINHALVIGGDPGIGKDTLIEPLVAGVGGHNFADVKPSQLMDRFNAHRKSVVLRVNEVYDLGEGLNRIKFYNLTKTLIAAPPETLQVEQKGIDVYSVPNVVGVIMTSNHKLDGLYLPDDDRRHYVAWSKITARDVSGDYFKKLYAWLGAGGVWHVVAFLAERDLSNFDAKAPPVQTRAFRSIAGVSRGSSNEEIDDVIGGLGNPDVFSWDEFLNKAPGALHDMAKANPRRLAGALEQEGYEKIENPNNKQGRWSVGHNAWVTVYARREMTPRDQIDAVGRWVAKRKADNANFGA